MRLGYKFAELAEMAEELGLREESASLYMKASEEYMSVNHPSTLAYAKDYARKAQFVRYKIENDLENKLEGHSRSEPTILVYPPISQFTVVQRKGPTVYNPKPSVNDLVRENDTLKAEILKLQEDLEVMNHKWERVKTLAKNK